MHHSFSITRWFLLGFILLSLSLCFLTALTIESRVALRGTAVQVREAVHIQYALRVHSERAALFFPEDYPGFSQLEQRTVHYDGSEFLVVEGYFSPESAGTEMLWLYARDWYTLLESGATSATTRYPPLGAGYAYRYENNDYGYLLYTDSPVADLGITSELSAPTFYNRSVHQLVLICVCEVFFLLSILLCWSSRPVLTPLAEKVCALGAGLPAEVKRAGERAYRSASLTLTAGSCAIRLLALLLILFVQTKQLALGVSALIAAFLVLILSLWFSALRKKASNAVHSCNLEKVQAILCAAVLPKFRGQFRAVFSMRNYLGADGGNIAIALLEALQMQLEGRPEQALELITLCHAMPKRLRPIDLAVYHCFCCYLYLDLDNRIALNEEVTQLKRSLEQVGTVFRQGQGKELQEKLYRCQEVMTLLLEGKVENVLLLAASLRADSEDTPLGQVCACALQYRVAQTAQDESLAQDCLTSIRRYLPAYADFLASR